MLRFYPLPDDAPQPSPSRLEELPLAGELSDEDFRQLQEQRIIEGRLSYEQGFRWSHGVVQEAAAAAAPVPAAAPRQPQQLGAAVVCAAAQCVGGGFGAVSGGLQALECG